MQLSTPIFWVWWPVEDAEAAFVFPGFMSGKDYKIVDMSFQRPLFLFTLAVVSAICWSIGRPIYEYSRYGFLTSIILGFVGAFLGKWVSRYLHLPWMFPVGVFGRVLPIIWSTIGGALLVSAVSIISMQIKRRRR